MKKVEKEVRKPLATWYRANSGWGRVEILPVQIVSFTAQTVTKIEKMSFFGSDKEEYRERREDRMSRDHFYAPTFEEAKAWLVRDRDSKVTYAQERLQEELSSLGVAKSLKETA